MTKGKDLTRFVRFGGLNVKKQKGFDPTFPSYHSPPTTRGFYAMPLVAQEFFLLGGMRFYQPGTVPNYPKEGEELTEQQWDAWRARDKKAFNVMRKEFTKTNGEIWHHLTEYVKPNEVIDRKGYWVKTDIKTWQKAFSKLSLNRRYGEERFDMGTKSITEPARSGVMGMYSKDECEVFFDEKV
jgi:hypothetical protein